MSDEVEIVNPKKHSGSNKQPNNTLYKAIIGVIAVIVIAGISFYGGVAYQKGHDKTTASTVNTRGSSFAGGSGRFGGGNRSFGTVSAISSSSITVQPSSGNAVTYTINSSTAITDSGQTVTYTDIQTGDTVIVSASTSSSTTAARILVNPSFGGGFGGGGTGGNPSSSNSDTQLN